MIIFVLTFLASLLSINIGPWWLTVFLAIGFCSRCEKWRDFLWVQSGIYLAWAVTYIFFLNTPLPILARILEMFHLPNKYLFIFAISFILTLPAALVGCSVFLIVLARKELTANKAGDLPQP